MKGSMIIGQSGGPTSAINASLYGAIAEGFDSPEITRVLGAHHGIAGILSDDLYDLDAEEREELDLLPYTPSAALGSCRHKLRDPDDDISDFEKILEIFRKYDCRYFFYIGGNDSMDTCEKISRYFTRIGYECQVMGIPKTIDNDLAGTDHCPGYGSAAKYIATSMLEIYKDCRVYEKRTITVVEAMGRNAGWLTASAALASKFGEGPDLIYLPERPFSLADFIDEATELYNKQGGLLVVVSEGIADENGIPLANNAGSEYRDNFGHSQLGGVANLLATILRSETNAKVRGVELSLLQRCASHCASLTDLREAELAGRIAVQAALEGETGKTVAFRRDPLSSDYHCKTMLIPLFEVANKEKKFPEEWINEKGNHINDGFIDYVLPLIQGEPERPLLNSLPRFTTLHRIEA
ncbi:MAG: 6-phosphofructokinase [Oscillospiraceae bacterium]|jgi:6-phosphofructokinase 1|nr:6-phosphofructokinase [Oscillospiraceae bacterium]